MKHRYMETHARRQRRALKKSIRLVHMCSIRIHYAFHRQLISFFKTYKVDFRLLLSKYRTYASC